MRGAGKASRGQAKAEQEALEEKSRTISREDPMASQGSAAAVAAGKTHQQRSEVRDRMRIDWDVPIVMDDGLVVRADVFRPVKDGRYPVILSYGPYAKGLAFQEGYPSAWQRMAEKHPDVTAGSSNLYQSWEVVDPEKWIPHNYICVRVDSRG